jgi:hypothetical protein
VAIHSAWGAGASIGDSGPAPAARGHRAAGDHPRCHDGTAVGPTPSSSPGRVSGTPCRVAMPALQNEASLCSYLPETSSKERHAGPRRENEGLADVAAANPFGLPRLRPGSGSPAYRARQPTSLPTGHEMPGGSRANSPQWRHSLVRQFGYSLPNPSGPEFEAGDLMSCLPVEQARDQRRDRQVPRPHNPTVAAARVNQVIE